MVVKSGGGSGAKEGAAGAAVRRWVEAGGGRLVLDGGLDTELEAHGADLNDPLWSAKCILSFPHLIRKASRRRPSQSAGHRRAQGHRSFLHSVLPPDPRSDLDSAGAGEWGWRRRAPSTAAPHDRWVLLRPGQGYKVRLCPGPRL